MKFEIIKKVQDDGVWFYTVPKSTFDKFYYSVIFHPSKYEEASPYRVFGKLSKAKLHIKRFNSGYYQNKYKTIVLGEFE